MRFLTLRSLFYSLVLHALIGAALISNFNLAHRPVLPPPPQDIVEAVTVDSQAVEEELKRLQELEDRERRTREKRLRELDQQAGAAERKRKEAEKKTQAAEQRRKAEEKKAADERRRLAAERKKQAAAQQKQAAEDRRLAAERKRLEANQQEQEAVRKRLAAEQRAAEEQKRQAEAAKREAEEERQRMEEERRRRAAAQQAQRERDQKLMKSVIADVSHQVSGHFNKAGLPQGLKCVLTVQTVPGGEVVGVKISKTSGNDLFDKRAIIAVRQASPLPLPRNTETLDRLRLRNFDFIFEPEE